MIIRDLTAADLGAARALMAGEGLAAISGAECALGAFESGALIGCCHLKHGLLQGLIIDQAHQGQGLMAELVSEALKRASELGLRTVGVITKPDAAEKFRQLGFRPVASAAPHAAYLEFGRGGVDEYRRTLSAAAYGKPEPRAAIIMNANPFSLGHRHLIERAATESAWVFVLVVEEDVSEFAYVDRLRLVIEGTADLPNVTVMGGGRYAVSSLTFPNYFTPPGKLAHAEGSLDAAIFASVIAPALGVTRRYVGTEPFSPVTNSYNNALRLMLPPSGIELTEVERLETGGTAISASEVRRRLHAGDIESLRALVPESTFRYIKERADD